MAAPRIDPLALLQQMQEHSRRTAPDGRAADRRLWQAGGHAVLLCQMAGPGQGRDASGGDILKR